MKKTMAIALLLLSPIAFAKNFTPNMLVGSWQCEAKFSFPSNKSQGKENYVITYYQNGSYSGKSTFQQTRYNDSYQTSFDYTGFWWLYQDRLSSNFETIKNYQISNPKVEALNQFEKDLKEDKTFDHYKIVKLTQNTLIKELAWEEQARLAGNIIDVCQRI